MAIDRCGNCEQVIGNLEARYFHLGEIVCPTCKKLLEKESKVVERLCVKEESENIVEDLQQQGIFGNEEQQDSNYVAPRMSSAQQDDPVIQVDYGGIGRLGYILGVFGIGFLQGIIDVATEYDPSVSAVMSLIAFVVAFGLAVSRLHNIGMSGWWSLLMLIPVLGLYPVVKCIICPKGYADTKKLDVAGKILAGLFIALFVLIIICVIFASVS